MIDANNNKVKPTPKEKPVEPEIVPAVHLVSIGDVRLESPSIPTNVLCSLAITLLKNKAVKDYLQINIKKATNGGIG